MWMNNNPQGPLPRSGGFGSVVIAKTLFVDFFLYNICVPYSAPVGLGVSSHAPVLYSVRLKIMSLV